MSMSKLNMSARIQPVFTGDDWGLYTASMDCSEAVNALNFALMFSVNIGGDREQVREHVDATMRQYDSFGSSDTEPRAFLEDVLDEIFGKPGQWRRS